MAKNQQDTAFRTLIDTLFEDQRAAWSSERVESAPSERSLEVKRKVYAFQRGWKELGDEKMLPTKQPNVVNFAEAKYLMPLPPLQKDGHLVPWLSVSYEQSEVVGARFEDACCRLYVLMLAPGEDGQLVGIGFRIESPERNCQQDTGADDSGRHDFYHAQLIRRIRTHGPQFDVPDWLPCNQPSFPLWALNPVDALLSLVLTLYGARYYKDFLRKYAARFRSIPMSNEFKQLHERLVGG